MNHGNRNYYGLTFLVGIITAALLMITVVIGMLAWETQKRLTEEIYDDSGLAAIQVRLHYEMLTRELRGLSAGADVFSVEDALTQYEIFYGRIRTFPVRPPYPELLDDEVKKLAHQSFQTLDKLTPEFEALGEGDLAKIPVLLKTLQPMRPWIERIAGRTVQLAPEFKARKRDQNARSLQWLMIAVTGLFVSAAAFAGLLWHSLIRESRHNAALAEARDQAVQASNAKSSFLAQMSHELRTPLNAIIGFADMIASEVHGPANERYIVYARDVRQAGRRLLHLITEMLDLSRIESGKLAVHMSDVMFDDIAAASVNVTMPRASESGIALRLEDNTTKAVYCDEMKMTQVLINLIDNAVKFSPKGETVTVRAEQTHDGTTTIYVIDRGCGMSQDELGKVMEPFAQVEERQARITNPGIGLGLPIVRALIELHNGTMKIESAIDQGTTVVLTLPPKPETEDTRQASA